ncbi:MAG: TonB-dependent receptor [Cyclobacteriaceae bacterium]|nr:TonB-dependent receptor [Cyclobacteriaceae bacterium]
MKRRILYLLKMASKNIFYGIMIQCVVFTGLLASEGSAQSVSIDKAIVKIDKKSWTLSEIISELESATEYRFVFADEVMQEEMLISTDNKKQSVKRILTDVAHDTGLRFRQINNNIYISKSENQENFLVQQYEQMTTVTGKVTSRDDTEGLPGVNVVIKGTTQGTVTDISGNYSIDVPGPNAILVFSSVGYIREEVVVGNRSVINFTMAPDVTALEEIVVIGYGQRERKDLTGAISQIGAEEISKQIAMSPEFAMQGRMSGVFVSNPGSSPTARPNIRIRGEGTLGFNDPLYVIDGIPLYEGGASSTAGRTQDQRGPINVFALINPNDIETITVLKDASATAIYGVRAANGVVLITTKRGKSGKAKVDVSTNFGIQNVPRNYDMVNTQDYLMLSQEALDNRNFTPPVQWRNLFDPNANEFLGNSSTYTQDWQQAALTQNAKIQDYSVNISGGNESSTYSVGVGYSSQENAVHFSKFDRYSLSINSDHKVTNWLRVGETYRFIYAENSERPSAGNLGSNAAPWQPLYDNTANGLLGYARTNAVVGGANRPAGFGPATQNNFRALGDLNYNERQLIRNIGALYAEATFLKNFRIRGSYSFDYSNNRREVFEDIRTGLFQVAQGGQLLTGQGNTYGVRNNENINLVGELLIGYNKSINNHNFDIIANVMDQRVYWNVSQQAIIANSPLSTWDQRRIEEGWFPTDKNNHLERSITGLLGYMGRLSYNYDRKYYLDATIRRDGSSRFGPGYKWGTFPSFAAAWRVSQESFMQGIAGLSDFKIRAGWGVIGNQETAEFAFLSQINVNPKAAFGPSINGNSTVNYAAGLLNFPTANLSWETSTTTNIGFDSEWFGGKLRFTAEYYHRLTDGILQNIPIPQVVGIVPSPVLNLAEVSNQGFEIEAFYNTKIGELGLNAGFNLTTVRNRVESIYNNVPQGSERNRVEVGHPMNFFWGFTTAGIFQTQEEVNAWKAENNHIGAQATKAPGDVIYVDIARPATSQENVSGANWQIFEPNGIIDDFDRRYIGKQIPGYYGGISLGADYKRFDLNLFFRYTGDVQREFSLPYLGIQVGGTNYHANSLNRWTPDNPSNTVPRAIQQDPSRNNIFSDRFVWDAGFLRFQNFQLGYTIAPNTLQRMGMSNARVFIMGQNLFVLSPFPDLDPENITTPRVFTIGANISF